MQHVMWTFPNRTTQNANVSLNLVELFVKQLQQQHQQQEQRQEQQQQEQQSDLVLKQTKPLMSELVSNLILLKYVG